MYSHRTPPLIGFLLSMKFLKRPRPGAGGSSDNHPQSSGSVELASSGPAGFGSGRNPAGENSRREPLVGAESETNNIRAGTQQKHPTTNGQHNDYYQKMPPQDLSPGKRIITSRSRGTFTDEDEGNNVGCDDDDGDDDEYSRYSSNYLADHNRNLHDNAALTDSKYPPPSPGGRRSAAGASYDRLNRSMSDYTAPFDDAEEWTPDDSAYGAACPVFGWIPKSMRKIIEATFIFVLVLIFVVVVISASIKMSNDKNGNRTGKWNGSGGSSGGSKQYTDDSVSNNVNNKNAKENDQQQMGDDYYVEHDGENDDNTDDYLNNGNNGGDANNNGGRGRSLLRRSDMIMNGVILRHGIAAEGKDSDRSDLLRRRVGKTYLW